MAGENQKTIVIFGPTGTAGSGVVRACLDDPRVSEVRAVTRRPLGFSHEKLVEVMCSNFADLTDIAEHLRGVDTCLFCLGISASKVKGEEQYRLIHVTYPLVAARALLAASPGASFVYLSGAGTNRDSRMMWARVKAEAEDQLSEIGLIRSASVRPGIILPVQPTGLSRWVAAPLLAVAPSMGIGALDLGRAMLRVGLDEKAGADRAVLENRDLLEVLNR